MKSIFRFDKEETVKEVYLNGLKQLEHIDYVVRKNTVKFMSPLVEEDEIVTLKLEKNYKVN